MKHTGESDSKLILLLGGARAGKSSCALRLARARESVNGSPVCFIATAQALDEEMATRISRHRTQRPGNWMTIEEPYKIDEALRKAAGHNIVILDCLTLFVSNWLLRCDEEEECQSELRQITVEFLQLVQAR